MFKDLEIHGSMMCRVANSMVEYSAFNRIVLGSSPRQPTTFCSQTQLAILINYLIRNNGDKKLIGTQFKHR